MPTPDAQPDVMHDVKTTAPIPLPPVRTPLPPEEIVAKLLRLAKRGKLAGFRRAEKGALFEAEAHGLHFDFRLDAWHETVPSPGLRFELRPLWKTPAIFIIATILAAGPGLWLTHSMLRTYFSWYDLPLWATAAWYEPLTIIPLPWIVWKAWKASLQAAHNHALETISKIDRELRSAAPSPSP